MSVYLGRHILSLLGLANGRLYLLRLKIYLQPYRRNTPLLLKMAELVGTIVAATQAVEYCLKLYEFFQRVAAANATLQRYLDIIQESQLLLKAVVANPSLQHPEIRNCTDTLIDTIKTIQVPHSYQRKNRFFTSIAFVFKQKHYEEIFSSLEKKKSTLSLHIANSNTTILNDIRAEVERLSESRQPAHILVESPEDIDMGTGNVNNKGSATSLSPTPPRSRSSSFAGMDDEKKQHGDQSTVVAMRHNPDVTPAEFQNNHHTGTGTQIVGTLVENTEPRVTGEHLVKITSNWAARNNRMSGKGDQIVGQYTKKGCLPIQFAGTYMDNVKTNKGDQIIGLRL
ncbi:hypothetical protein F4677DRAFT_183092 [Hypoxylon crocopeplum]|nr:hypothetical protein F4677DRAFT_183092 [Hypoxylon crocopeplum]